MTYDKPLFVPLRREWFEAFQRREKFEEWRRYGKQWNERVCWIGRPVQLSLGYRSVRLLGTVVSFRTAPARRPGAGDLYGEGTICAVFGVKID